jgi:hypothetical protein
MTGIGIRLGCQPPSLSRMQRLGSSTNVRTSTRAMARSGAGLRAVALGLMLASSPCGTYNLRSAKTPATPIALPGGGLRGEVAA